MPPKPQQQQKPPWHARAAFSIVCQPSDPLPPGRRQRPSSSLRAPCACASACGPGGSIRRLRGRGARTAFRRSGGSSSHGTRPRAAASFQNAQRLVNIVVSYGYVHGRSHLSVWFSSPPPRPVPRALFRIETGDGAIAKAADRDKVRVVSYLRRECKARTGFRPDAPIRVNVPVRMSRCTAGRHMFGPRTPGAEARTGCHMRRPDAASV